MNKTKFLQTTLRLLTVALLTGAMASCAAKGGVGDEENSSLAATGVSTQGTDKTDGKVRTVSLAAFNGIYNNGIVAIHFTQGDTQSVRVKDAKNNHVTLQVEDHALFIDFEGHDQLEKRELGTYSTPDSKRLRKPEVAFSHTEDIDTAQVWITLPKLELLENMGQLYLRGAILKGDVFLLKNSGVCSFAIKKVKMADFKSRNTGVCNLSGQLETTTADFQNDGVVNEDLQIKAKKLTVRNKGVGNTDTKFNGGSLELSNTGVGNLSYQVQCESLEADNSGVGNVTLSGTADQTKFNSSGEASIDTSELNQL